MTPVKPINPPGIPIQLIQLHETDNVAVLPTSASAGAALVFRDWQAPLDRSCGLGHKIALVDIETGEKIRKYSVAIGSATKAIRKGEHVHLHNMKSDYLPTFTLDEGQHFTA